MGKGVERLIGDSWARIPRPRRREREVFLRDSRKSLALLWAPSDPIYTAINAGVSKLTHRKEKHTYVE